MAPQLLSTAFLLAILLLLASPIRAAQAECTLNNSLPLYDDGRSPCDIISLIELPYGGSPPPPATNDSQFPYGIQTVQCDCTIEAYNLLMACTVCQFPNNKVWTVEEWKNGCNNITIPHYDFTVLPNVDIPAWARVFPQQVFNLSSALALAMAEATLTQSSTSTTSTTTSTTTTVSTTSTTPITTPSSPPTPTAIPHVNSSHVGAIAGGVVGAIVVLVLLLLAGWWLFTKRNQTVENLDLGSPKHSIAEQGTSFPLSPTHFSSNGVDIEDESSNVTPAFLHSYVSQASPSDSKATMRAISNLPPGASPPSHINPKFRPDSSIDPTYSATDPSVISDSVTSNLNPHLSMGLDPNSSMADNSSIQNSCVAPDQTINTVGNPRHDQAHVVVPRAAIERIIRGLDRLELDHEDALPPAYR